VVLAAFTYTSGLRGATLTAVLKDITVIAVIVVVPLSISGGFGTAFRDVRPNYLTVPSPLVTGYATLVLGSVLALYLYPHAINGVLSSESVHKFRRSTELAESTETARDLYDQMLRAQRDACIYLI
jgi:SSS family solute:Na+ symporter